MANQADTNEVTSSTDMAEMRKRQEFEAWSAIQREAVELNAEGPAIYDYYMTKERALKNLTERIVSGIKSVGETVEVQDRLISELVTEKKELEFNIITARVDVSNLKEELKERRIRYKKLFRRNTYIQSLLNEEKTLVAELAKLNKKKTHK